RRTTRRARTTSPPVRARTTWPEAPGTTRATPSGRDPKTSADLRTGLAEEPRHTEGPAARAIGRELRRNREVAGRDRLVGVLQGAAVLVCLRERSVGCDPLVQASHAHLAGEGVERRRAGTWWIDQSGRNSVAGAHEHERPLRALAGRRVCRRGDKECAGGGGGRQERQPLPCAAASHSLPPVFGSRLVAVPLAPNEVALPKP